VKPTVEAEMHRLSFKIGRWLLTAIAGGLIIGNSLYLAAFYFARAKARGRFPENGRLSQRAGEPSAQWQQLTPEWVGQVPPGLRFSQPVGGLSIALQEPRPIPAHSLQYTGFRVWILNRGSDVAFSRHVLLVRLAVYDRSGQFITDLENYGAELRAAAPGLGDLVILRPGEMMRTLTLPLTLDETKVHRGIYQVEAILVAPPAEWWLDPRRSWDMRKELQREGITVWGPGKIVSPRLQVELQ
jgi:hypothetical protein